MSGISLSQIASGKLWLVVASAEIMRFLTVLIALSEMLALVAPAGGAEGGGAVLERVSLFS